MSKIAEFVGNFVNQHEMAFNMAIWLGILVFAIGCYFFRWWLTRFVGKVSGYRED